MASKTRWAINQICFSFSLSSLPFFLIFYYLNESQFSRFVPPHVWIKCNLLFNLMAIWWFQACSKLSCLAMATLKAIFNILKSCQFKSIGDSLCCSMFWNLISKMWEKTGRKTVWADFDEFRQFNAACVKFGALKVCLSNKNCNGYTTISANLLMPLPRMLADQNSYETSLLSW